GVSFGLSPGSGQLVGDTLQRVDGSQQVAPVSGDLFAISGQTVVVPEVLERRADAGQLVRGVEELLFEWATLRLGGSGRPRSGTGLDVEVVEFAGGHAGNNLVVRGELRLRLRARGRGVRLAVRSDRGAKTLHLTGLLHLPANRSHCRIARPGALGVLPVRQLRISFQ